MNILFRRGYNQLKQAVFFFWLLLFSVLSSGIHPFYLSITDIEFFPEDQLVGVTIRVFTDDLEMVVESLTTASLRLGSVEEHPEANAWIAQYLDREIAWTVNGIGTNMIWLGKEVENDVTFLYLEASGVPQLKQVEVSNHLFLEHLETQENIMHLHCGSDLKSVRLNKGNPKGLMTCE